MAYRARLGEGLSLIEDGKGDEALAVLEGADADLRKALESGTIRQNKQWNQLSYDLILAKADYFRGANDLVKAIELYHRLVAEYGDKVDVSEAKKAAAAAGYHLGIKLLMTGRYEEAVTALKQSIEDGGYEDAKAQLAQAEAKRDARNREQKYQEAVSLMMSSFIEAKSVFLSLPRAYKKVSSYLARINKYSALMGDYMKEDRLSFNTVTLDPYLDNGNVVADFPTVYLSLDTKPHLISGSGRSVKLRPYQGWEEEYSYSQMPKSELTWSFDGHRLRGRWTVIDVKVDEVYVKQ